MLYCKYCFFICPRPPVSMAKACFYAPVKVIHAIVMHRTHSKHAAAAAGPLLRIPMGMCTSPYNPKHACAHILYLQEIIQVSHSTFKNIKWTVAIIHFGM